MSNHQAAVANARHYGIVDLVNELRADLPATEALAICEIESCCNPNTYNYPIGKGRYRDAIWKPGSPWPANAHAVGLCQIRNGRNSRRLTIEQRFDARRSLGVILPEWRAMRSRCARAGLAGDDLLRGVYYGHNQGAGLLSQALHTINPDGRSQPRVTLDAAIGEVQQRWRTTHPWASTPAACWTVIERVLLACREWRVTLITDARLEQPAAVSGLAPPQ